jgi:hypothetical protein
MEGTTPDYRPMPKNPLRYTIWVPDVIFFHKTFVILGEDHVKNVWLQRNKLLLDSWLPTVKNLARDYGIYFEGMKHPSGPIQDFLTKFLIKGQWNTWDDVKLQPQEYLLGDTFGGDFRNICPGAIYARQPKGLTLGQVLERCSQDFTYNKKHIPLAKFKKLMLDHGTKEQQATLDKPWDKELFKKFHEEIQEEAFEKTSSKWYALQISGSLSRGERLKELCMKKGGLYFVGSSHIDRKGCKDYRFV